MNESFFFCLPIPTKQLTKDFIYLINKQISLWNNLILLGDSFVVINNESSIKEILKTIKTNTSFDSLNLLSLNTGKDFYSSLESLITHSLEKFLYYIKVNKVNTDDLPTNFVLLIEDWYQDLTQIDYHQILVNIVDTLKIFNYRLKTFILWFTSTDYIPVSYVLNSLSGDTRLYLALGFDNNLINAIINQENKSFNALEYVLGQVKALNVELIEQKY